MIRKLIYKMRKRRFCKLNRWFCPDCIYHDFVFDEYLVFRGNRCRYPKYREREKINPYFTFSDVKMQSTRYKSTLHNGRKENIMDSVTRCPCHKEPIQKTALEIIEEVKSDICDKVCKYRDYYDQETLLEQCCDGCPLERLA